MDRAIDTRGQLPGTSHHWQPSSQLHCSVALTLSWCCAEPLLPTQRQKEESGRHNVEHYAHFEWDSDDEGATEYQGPSDDYVTGVRRKEADGRCAE